jgi:hypothetical protein
LDVELESLALLMLAAPTIFGLSESFRPSMIKWGQAADLFISKFLIRKDPSVLMQQTKIFGIDALLEVIVLLLLVR